MKKLPETQTERDAAEAALAAFEITSAHDFLAGVAWAKEEAQALLIRIRLMDALAAIQATSQALISAERRGFERGIEASAEIADRLKMFKKGSSKEQDSINAGSMIAANAIADTIRAMKENPEQS